MQASLLLVHPVKEDSRNIRFSVPRVVTILSCAATGAKPNQLTYDASLPWPELESYLGVLEKEGLLARFPPEGDKTPVVKTTEKGLSFVESYSKLQTDNLDQTGVERLVSALR